MSVYKFLGKGRHGALSGFTWPEPGEWVTVEGELALGANGVHVCRVEDLAWWLHDELWETEIDGELLPGLDCQVSRRARLVRPVDGWNAAGARKFADACLARAQGLETPAVRGLLEEAAQAAAAGYVAVAAYTAGLVIARRQSTQTDVEHAFREERGWQSTWLVREVLRGL